jgi:chemotaxis protein CheC
MVQYYTKKGVKALEKMSHVAASKASESLSQLINQSAEVKTVSVRTISIQNLSKTLAKPTEIVSSIVMEVHGDVNGSIMLVYPEQSAFNVADFLSKRALGTTQKIDELDKSALKESGNIVAGAFLGRLSDYVNVNMVESTPELITNELKIVVDEVVSRFGNKEFAEAIAFEIMYEMS